MHSASTLIKRGLLALALASVAALSHAGVKPVTVAPQVTGEWVTPDGAWDGRTVLLLHGFADDLNGAGDLSKRMSAKLAQMGIASLRINFRGEGARMRSDIDSTLDSRVADTEAAYAFLRQQAGVKVAHSAVLGWSLGGATAMVVGGRHPDWFRSMVLWSTPSGDLYKYFMSKPTAQKAVRDGVASEVVPGWKTIVTKREFYESFKGVDFDKALAAYPGAFLTVRGSKDYLPQRDLDLIRIAPGKPAQAEMIDGADHVFNVFEANSPAPQRVIDITANWLAKTL
ncbi:dienelactone hydrolase [Duganella sp. 1411]|uniref:alpha/beta hydrolase family protein n=1 Tax=Duganella sp. 1411 TaxID=2806572 RepID=UPI001AE93212|nr:alpha/beta fold hydrolase [Duganella sp. 1411]MBP1207643.1 dienelactone hydrolase [Duganella sp. 1411]